MNVKFLFLSLFFVSTIFAEEIVHLEYLPERPVEQSSILDINIHNQLPGLKFNAAATQTLNALITIQEGPSQPPFNMLFRLKGVEIAVKVNDRDTELFTGNDPKTVQWAQVNRLKNRPLTLSVDETNLVSSHIEELKHLFRELPALQSVPIDLFLGEWFHPVFALAGKDLKVGKSYQVDTDLSGNKAVLQYEIKSITDSAVLAHVTGKMAAKEQELTLLLPGNSARLLVEGNVNGDVLWNRDNALVCQATLYYQFQGQIHMADAEWPLHLEIKNQLESIPKS